MHATNGTEIGEQNMATMPDSPDRVMSKLEPEPAAAQTKATTLPASKAEALPFDTICMGCDDPSATPLELNFKPVQKQRRALGEGDQYRRVPVAS